MDPRVIALCGILGFEVSGQDMETALALSTEKSIKRWIDEAPVNPVAAMAAKGGIDEALNANIMIAAGPSIERKMSP